MAKLKVFYKCDHSEYIVVQKWQIANKEKTLDYYAEKTCFKCKLKEKEVAAKEWAAVVKQLNHERGFVELRYSSDYYESVRFKHYNCIKKLLESDDEIKIIAAKSFLSEECEQKVNSLNRYNDDNLFLALLDNILEYDYNSRKIFNLIESFNKKMSLDKLIGDKEKNVKSAEIFRYFAYDKIDKYIDSSFKIYSQAAILLLSETSANTWISLKIKHNATNNIEYILDCWIGILNTRRKYNEKDSIYIESKLENNDVLSDDILIDETKIVHGIFKFNTLLKSKKTNRILVIIERPNLKASEQWLSEKQFMNLSSNFELINSDYSHKNNIVFAVFEKESDKFIWSGVITGEKDDRDFIRKSFRVSTDFKINGLSKSEFVERNLEIPQNVEVLAEFIDEDNADEASAECCE